MIHSSSIGEFLLDRMVVEGDVTGEPRRDQLFAGEAVAVKSWGILSKRGRSRVRVRVLGGSLTWVEVAGA